MALNLKYVTQKLTEAGYFATTGNSYLYSRGDLSKSGYLDEAMGMYENLNGLQKEIPLKKIQPAIVINERIFLELDDHSHFNRYRMVTLRSHIYANLKGIDRERYRRYCRMYEKECLKSGLKMGVWSSKESIHHFGMPSDPGDFFANGSPGWKLISLEDYLLDLFAVAFNFKIIRISIYDNLLIDNRLSRAGKFFEGVGNLNPFIKFIEKRIKEV